ncbi:hypothetical protein B7P43_G03442, partial [Cryptotermes secundus]
SRDSAVSIVIGYGLDDRVVGVRIPGRSRTFSFPMREADHSPPSNAEVKKTWIFIPISPHAFMA